nr:hypothetical protein [Tanacetum cinerariifolium]
QITKVDPPVGLFVNHIISLFKSDFVSLDPRLQSKKSAMDRSFTLGSTEEADNVKILQSFNGLLLFDDDFGSSEFTIYEMMIGSFVWMVRYRVHTDDFMTPLPEEIAEEEGFLKFLCDRCDDLRRKNAKCRVLIHEMEALRECEVAVDSLGSLKQTHARETTKLAAFTDAIVESLAGIHEKERHVAVDSLGSLKQTHARETTKLAAFTDAIVESLAGIHEKERHVAKMDLND